MSKPIFRVNRPQTSSCSPRPPRRSAPYSRTAPHQTSRDRNLQMISQPNLRARFIVARFAVERPREILRLSRQIAVNIKSELLVVLVAYGGDVVPHSIVNLRPLRYHAILAIVDKTVHIYYKNRRKSSFSRRIDQCP